MKHLIESTIAVLGLLFVSIQISAQSPNSMSYQAVIRNAANTLVENQSVGIQISILQGAVDGPSVFTETHMVSSNTNGLVSLAIGNGTLVSGNLSTIPWEDDTYFIKTETDPTGGSIYTITGVSQMLTVPYAMHAKTAVSLTGPLDETDPVFDNSAASGINPEDITNWDSKLETEVDPTFQSSVAAGIDSGDITSWDSKLETEVDPTFQSSAAAGIASGDIVNWDSKLETEVDPTFQSSAAAGIDSGDITSWDSKLETEVDPTFQSSAAAGIVSGDIVNWDAKLETEVDGDVTNELQELNVVGDTIFISDGNFIVLPGLSYLAALLPGPSAQERIDNGETPLEIYNSDNALLDSLYGCTYAGGLICYFDPSDGSGIVCTEADQTQNMHWYNCVYTITGATLEAIGTGAFNTGLIIADQGFGFYAASVCDMADDGGFEDWILPSKDELEQIYLNLQAAGKGNFADEVYWCSTEQSSTEAWSMDFTMGTQSIMQKLFPQNVRAIRNFE